MFKNKYRIVTDKFSGYEVQFKPWYLPFYYQVGDENNKHTNTSYTVEDAELLIERHKSRKVRVVKYVD